MPKIEKTLKYIESELDERSKEEKFKIKKVLNFKQKHKQANSELPNGEIKAYDNIDDGFTDEEDEIDESERLFK